MPESQAVVDLDPFQPSDRRGLRWIVLAALMALAANAVLIQTIVSDESPVKYIVRGAALLAVLVATYVNRTWIPQWLLIGVLLSVALLLLTQNTDQFSYIFVLLFVPVLWSIPERTAEKFLVLASLASLALVFIFLGLGITHDVVLVTHDVVLEARQRATFGTQGVPFFFNLVYGASALLVLYAFKYELKLRLPILLPVAAGATYLFTQTDARGGYYAFLGFLVGIVAVPRLSRYLLFRGLTAALPVIFLSVAFYISSLAYNQSANQLLSYRPINYRVFLQSLGLRDYLLSTSVKRFDQTSVIVDNSYLHLLVGGGFGLFMGFTIVFAVAVLELFREGRHYEVAFLIATCFYFNSESILVRIENIFVIYAWYLIVRFAIAGGSRARDSSTTLSTRSSALRRSPQ